MPCLKCSTLWNRAGCRYKQSLESWVTGAHGMNHASNRTTINYKPNQRTLPQAKSHTKHTIHACERKITTCWLKSKLLFFLFVVFFFFFVVVVPWTIDPKVLVVLLIFFNDPLVWYCMVWYSVVWYGIGLHDGMMLHYWQYG
jgi:hypothetical protein